MQRSIFIRLFLLAVAPFFFTSPVAFGSSFQSGAFGSPQSLAQLTNVNRIVSVYEGDRTGLQLTTVPQMRSSVFKDSNADNGRANSEAGSRAGLPEGLFKLTDPERIAKLEQLAGSPLTLKSLTKAFTTSLQENPDQSVSTGASALFLARTINASPRQLVNLMRTGILILAAKGTQYLAHASALVGFAVQVSDPIDHPWIVASLRTSMIGALPENMPDTLTFRGMHKGSKDTISRKSLQGWDSENFSNTHAVDMALVNAGILEAGIMDDFMWAEVQAMMTDSLMENLLRTRNLFRAFRVDGDKDVAIFQFAFVAFRLEFGDAHSYETAGDSTHRGTDRGTAECSKNGACGNKWSHSGNCKSADPGDPSQGSSNDAAGSYASDCPFRCFGMFLVCEIVS